MAVWLALAMCRIQNNITQLILIRQTGETHLIIPCAVRNYAFQDLRLASPIVETAPSERILNGVTSAVSTCGISIALIIHSLDPLWGYQDLNRSRFGDRSYKIGNSQQRGVYLGGFIVEECTINVGFHSNFGTFRRSRDSKTSLRSAIINEISFNPTYDP